MLWLDRNGVETPQNVKIVNNSEFCSQKVISTEGDGIVIPEGYDAADCVIIYRKPVKSFGKITYTNSASQTIFAFNDNILRMPTDNKYGEFVGECDFCMYDKDKNEVIYTVVG